jgi:hypothetical protein
MLVSIESVERFSWDPVTLILACRHHLRASSRRSAATKATLDVGSLRFGATSKKQSKAKNQSCGSCLDLPWNVSGSSRFQDGPFLRDFYSVSTCEESSVIVASKSALVLMTASEAAAWRAEDRSITSRFTYSSRAIKLVTWVVNACNWASCVRAALVRSSLRDSSILQSVMGTSLSYQMKDRNSRAVYQRGKQS